MNHERSAVRHWRRGARRSRLRRNSILCPIRSCHSWRTDKPSWRRRPILCLPRPPARSHQWVIYSMKPTRDVEEHSSRAILVGVESIEMNVRASITHFCPPMNFLTGGISLGSLKLRHIPTPFGANYSHCSTTREMHCVLTCEWIPEPPIRSGPPSTIDLTGAPASCGNMGRRTK